VSLIRRCLSPVGLAGLMGLLAALWLAPLCLPDVAWAQVVPVQRESAVKAAFLYKFGAFVDWPAGTFEHADAPLVIGVAGDDAVAADLEQLLSGRSLDGRPVVLRRVGPDASAFAAVHVLFVGRRSTRLHELIAAAAGPVLVVTDQEPGLPLGSVINFSSEGGRMRFSVSLAAADARALRLSARLLAVARDVEGRTR
jgi:hypothetical protein